MLGRYLSLSFPEAVALNSSYVDAALVERLTGSPPRDVVGLRVAEAEALAIPGNAAASVSRYDQRTYLPCLLDRMDRMTMAYGLEGRVPFLDVGLAEWAGTVPARYRLGWTGNKMLVKRLAERYLSRGVTHGPKSGFGVPVGDWLRTPAWSDVIERLRDRNHAAANAVDAAQVRAVVDAHLAGTPGLGDVLWLLTNLYLWHEVTFTRGRSDMPAIAGRA
jgi:asparagine synthase (glutamine-hydrolysing)